MRRLPRVILIFVGLFFLSPTQAPDATRLPRLAYTVRIPTLADGRIGVSLLVSDLDPASPLIIRSVPLYMDNPVAAADGPMVIGFQATDSPSGERLGVTARDDKDGETVYEIANQDKTAVRIDYQVRVRLRESDQTRAYPIRIPYLNRKQTLLYGNYLFCYPELGKDKQESASVPLQIGVDLQPPDGAFFWGIARRFSVHTVYQLMSLHFGLGAYEEDRLPVTGIRLSVVYERIKDFSSEERQALRKVVPVAFEAVRELFGETPFDHFSVLVFRDQAVGGMEGTFACQVFGPRDLDMANAGIAGTRNFYSIITHEIFHTWNPIAAFPRDDPWIKEGVTNYYGEVLSARAGLVKEDDLVNTFRYYVRQLDRNDLMKKVSLTDPIIWQNEYLNEDWRTITYERGKAVALLLDLQIRENSGNRRCLDDVMRYLYRQYRNRSYSHEEFESAASAATGVDLSGFFRDYVAGTRVPSEREIESARKRISELGVYEAALQTVR